MLKASVRRMDMRYRVKYDPEADVLLLIFEEKGKLDHAEEADGIVIHYSDDGRIIMVEVLNASRIMSQPLWAP